jgi:branched-chain amino acid transport system permease protein
VSELRKQLSEWRASLDTRFGRWWIRGVGVIALVIAIILPFFFAQTSGFLNATILALAYVVMALGLNVVVGFAGLLDLGYVAFYAFGAYSVGWFGSTFFFNAHAHILTASAPNIIGIHFNFVLIVICAIVITSIAGIIIGLPTLRLRGDYIAIVTLAFGEIIGVVVTNGTDIHIGGGMTLTNGNLGISAVDPPYFPFIGKFTSLKERPWYWLIFLLVLIVLFVSLRLRDSRLGRAWIALREDEVAAVSMGIPLVRTKLMAYAIGAAFGGMSGVFLGAYATTVNASQFQFSFSIFVLSMVIVGGLGSVWGVVAGALLLSYINYYLIPDVLKTLPRTFGLNFDLTQLSFGIFGFILVLVMVLRPQGLFPERRRRLELTGEIAAEDAQMVEAAPTGST